MATKKSVVLPSGTKATVKVLKPRKPRATGPAFPAGPIDLDALAEKIAAKQDRSKLGQTRVKDDEAKCTPIYGAVEDILNNLDALDTASKNLIQAITPVLLESPLAGETDEGSPMPDVSPLHQRLLTINARLHYTIDNLNRTTQSVQL